MSNHLHLIISAKQNDVSDVVGNFKKFTSKQMVKVITEHPGESRKEWMLKIFKKAGEKNSRNLNYHFLATRQSTKSNIHSSLCSAKIRIYS
jgi:putative transposase